MKLFKTKEKPTIYTMENCNYCTMVKEKLTEENISFIEKDIKESKKDWENVLRKTGFANTPTIVFKNNYLAPMRDFANPNQLIVMLSELTKKSLNELIDLADDLTLVGFPFNPTIKVVNNSVYDKIIDYFCELEEYEKCQEILDIKNKNK